MLKYNKKMITILFLIMSILSSIFLSGCTDETNNVITDKWLFAMDNNDFQRSVQYKYNASAIPTLVIIDKDGDVIFYNRGKHDKEVLIPYIEKAIEGTANKLGASIDFTVKTFNNETFTLSGKKGHVVLLDIMGVGCPPCVAQMPELQEIKTEYGNNVILLSVDVRFTGETQEKVIETYGEYILL
jgi:thiol-disulfide isomerase/thioredoxin